MTYTNTTRRTPATLLTIGLAVLCFLNFGCGTSERRSEQNWIQAQDSIRHANSTLSAGRIEDGADLYASLWRTAREPNPPDNSPTTSSLAEPMSDWSSGNDTLRHLWQPLVQEGRDQLERPAFSRDQMRDFLLITKAASDEASLVAYFDSIADDWRDKSQWNSDSFLRDDAAKRLVAAGRNDLAQAYIPTRVGVPPPPVVLFDRALHGMIDPVLAPMMAPK